MLPLVNDNQGVEDPEDHRVDELSIENEYQFIKCIDKLEIKPGDILVVRFKHKVPNHVMNNIGCTAKKLGIKNKIMVLEDNVNIALLRPVKDGQSD